MNKKEYKKPSMKVIEINSNDIICGSPGEPTTFSITNDYVDDDQQGSTSSDIWGKQW